MLLERSKYVQICLPSSTDLLRQYLTQLRQECGLRLVDRVFESETSKPCKWWTCFAKRKFMDISLSGHGL